MIETSITGFSLVSSKEAARRNLARKIGILEKWMHEGIPWEYSNEQPLRDSEGCRICVYFPTSLRSFNVWCSAKYTRETSARLGYVCEISGNGVDTLNKHPLLKARALDLIQSLLKISKAQKEAEGPHRIAVLEHEMERLNIFIENQAKKLVALQRDNMALLKGKTAIERREKGNFDELTKSYGILDKQNCRLREEISMLTKQLRKISSLKEANGDN